MSVKQQAEMLVTDYLLTDSFLPYTSIFAGIVMSKMVSPNSNFFFQVDVFLHKESNIRLLLELWI